MHSRTIEPVISATILREGTFAMDKIQYGNAVLIAAQRYRGKVLGFHVERKHDLHACVSHVMIEHM